MPPILNLSLDSLIVGQLTGKVKPRDMQHTRKQTGTRRKQGERRAEILAAARKILETESYAEFTLRKIAERTGLRLASLQYHFRTKEELLRALLEDTLARYEERLTILLSQTQTTPKARFLKAIDWLIHDGQKEEVAHFFAQLLALATHEPYGAEVVDQIYVRYQQGLATLMEPLNPRLKPAVRMQRAALLASMIDGVSIFRGPNKPRHKNMVGIEKQLHAFALKLAIDP